MGRVRNRKKKGQAQNTSKNGGMTVEEPEPSAAPSASGASSGKGGRGDNKAQAEGEDQPLLSQPMEEEEEELNESEYSDPDDVDDYDSSDEDYEPPSVPARVDYNTDAEDTVVLIAGALGFVFFLCFGAALPVLLHIDQSMVMAGGMLSLLAVIILVNFCPQRFRKLVFPKLDVDEIPPLLVFLITGSLATMIGGMFGGTLKHLVK